jgi:hypothetical protein
MDPNINPNNPNQPAPVSPNNDITRPVAPTAPMPPPAPTVDPATLFTSDQNNLSPFQQPRKKRRKLWFFLLLIILLAAGGGYYYEKHKAKPAPAPAATNTAAVTLASAKPQYTQKDSVAGYLQYDASKFKEVTTLGLPPAKSTDPNVNVVIVQANVVSYADAGLYLYDLSTNKSYQLTTGGGSPRIMSDHFLLYGFDEQVDGKQTLGGKLLDLNTGVVKTIFSGLPADLPGNVCCSVSPDGYKAIFPQKDKIGIFDIRTNVVTNYNATVAPVAAGSVTTTSPTEISYAAPVWVDNNSIIYADKPATTTLMVNGFATKPPADTNLFSLDLGAGKSTEIPTGSSGIYDIYSRGTDTFVNEYTTDTKVNQFSKLATIATAKSDVLANTGNSFQLLSPKGDKLYLFPTLTKTGGYTVIDTATKTGTAFNPVPADITSISQIIPKGWAGQDSIIIQILDTATATNHEYIGIYNTTSNKVEQYTKIK